MKTSFIIALLIYALAVPVSLALAQSDAGPAKVAKVTKTEKAPETAVGKPIGAIDKLKHDLADIKAKWKAYKDKNDGNSNSHDLLALLVGFLAVISTWGKTGLRYFKARKDE